MIEAPVKLLEWQRRYLNDTARRKFLAASVQVGKSFISSLETFLDALESGQLWIMLSASDRQSVELMQKVQTHKKAAGVVMDVETDFFERTSIVQHTAKFPNGGRIIALPANPDTARGFSGNVLLDEFAIHKDAKSIWKAMAGRTLRGYKLRVVSSFKGKANKFYDLAKEIGVHEGIEPPVQPVKAGVWSGHWISLEMAVRQGLAVDIQELQDTIGDEDIFLEECMCVPIDGALDFIPLEMVQACESGDARMEFDGLYAPGRVAGMDIGRKRDLSVIWVLDRDETGLLTCGLIRMARKPFAEQLETARGVAGCVDRLCIDASGIGAMFAETLKGEFPGVVEAVEFTGPVKERMGTELKTRMEDIGVRIPEERGVRRAIQAVKRYVGPTGNVRLDAARTQDGHADEFWALALAVSAASGPANYTPMSDGGLVGEPVGAGLLGRMF